MAKTKTLSFMVSDEENREVHEYVKTRAYEADNRITQSDILREAIFALIRKGKVDDKQVLPPVPDPPPKRKIKEDVSFKSENPTQSKNPFADLKF